MKITKQYIFALILVTLMFENSLENKNKHKKSKKLKDNPLGLRPRVADLNSQMKVIRPFIEKPFLPQEVEKLSENQRKKFDITEMKSAILLPSKNKESLEEKPSMYSTVIDNHPTAVVHPVPQPVNYALQKNTASAFSVDQKDLGTGTATQTLPGTLSIPIEMKGASINDPTLKGYEVPSFIHKGEKSVQDNSSSDPIDPQAHMQQSIQNDIKTFIAQFDNAKDKAERIQVLIEGKHRLAEESKALSAQVEAEMKELLYSKEIATKLQNLVVKYSKKLSKDINSELKLADVVTIKDILRNKLHRELQGFRTSKGEYKELEIVNPDDISKIIQEIKTKLGE